MKQNDQRRTILTNALLIVLILLASISVLQGVRNAIGTARGSFDFQYDSALLFRLKINPYDESLNPTGISEKLGLLEYYDKVEANQFPSLLAILIPLTFLKPYAANIIWLIINLAMTGAIIILSKVLFFKEMDDKVFAILVLFMLAGTGWRNNIGNGQHTIFAFAFFLGALWFAERDQTALSGIALAISYFKYTLIVPLALYFVYKKKYKELAISVGIHLVATPICAWWLNDSIINMIKKPLMVSGALSSAGYIDFGSIFHLESSSGILLAVLACSISLALSFLHTRGNGKLLYAILSYVSLIVIYHRAYDFFILIIPVGIFALMWIHHDHMENRIYLYNLILSIGIFVYANFVQKLIDITLHRIEFVNVISPFLKMIYAAIFYIFVVSLVIQYIFGGSGGPNCRISGKETCRK